MRVLAKANEHEIVATFLQAELHSERFGHELRHLMQRDSIPDTIVERADVHSASENECRLRLFGEFRGYPYLRLFENFPQKVDWHWVELPKQALPEVNYIDYDYWVELSGGTRRPDEAAKRIIQGLRVFDMDTSGFFKLADAVRRGVSFPPLIFVSTSLQDRLVVLEGHARLTGYCLAMNATPMTLTAMLGISPDFNH